MRVMVTGSAGFVGQHMLRILREAGHDPLGVDSAWGHGVDARFDIMDRKALATFIHETRPEAAIHLAAMSFIPDGDLYPKEMLDINVNGTINLLDAFSSLKRRSRVLLASSAQVYGSGNENGGKLGEEAPMRPFNYYAISKAAAELAALGRQAAGSCEVVIARPGNHTGPGQSDRFVAPAFIRQLKDFMAGRLDHIEVGNLESVRDFSDVRDVAAAYLALLEKGKAGAIYNISSDQHLRVGDLLDRLCAIMGANPERLIVPERFRTTDFAPRLDTGRIQHDTNWQPRYPIEQTLKDMTGAG